MAENRASKRRKLDTESPPLLVQDDSQSLPRSRRSKGSLAENINDSAIANGQQAPQSLSNLASADKKRTRRSDAADPPASQPVPADMTSTASGTNGSAHPDSTPKKAVIPSPRSLRRSNGHLSGNTPGGVSLAEEESRSATDVHMEDAPSIAADSQADSLDTDAPRMSGRKRQKSRRLEEAEAIVKKGTAGSPSTQGARRSTARQTPSKAAAGTPNKAGTKSTPASGRGKRTLARNALNEVANEAPLTSMTSSTEDPPAPSMPDALPQEAVTLLNHEDIQKAVKQTASSIPLPKPRRARISTPQKRAKDSEIPDSEPETEDKDKAKSQGRRKKPDETSMVVPHDEQPQQHEQEGIPEEVIVQTTAPPIKSTVQETPKKKRGPISKKAAQNGPPEPTPPVMPETPERGKAQTNASEPTIQLNGDAPSLAVETLGLSVEALPPFSSQELFHIQTEVTRNLARRSPQTLVGLGMEIRKVANLVEQTITAGESNSMVLIGARGSGKTAIVDSILAQQRSQHAADFHVVRLSGFIHTDDRVAIREIWRQLGREMEIEDDNQVKNYADTLTTLLALLSHPSETGHAEEGRVAKSVVIILDEFDLFTTHPRQTLLYNLFDIAQSRKAPIAVLGLTTRFDVAESLEKRVKSRFSHRQVYIPLAKNFAGYKDMCKSCLTITDTDNLPNDLSSRWSDFIAVLFDSSTGLNTHLQSLYHTSKSVPAFQTSLLIPFFTLRTDDSLDAINVQAHIETSLSLAPSLSRPDSNLTLLPSLSTLELALLICAARLLIIHDTESASFPLAYDEYKSLASKARIAASAAGALATGSGARVWGVGVARLAWEGLVEKGLVLPVSDRARGGGGVCKIDVSLEELGVTVEATVDAAGMGKWCREI